MNHSSFFRHTNIFDDNRISSDQLEKYRQAKPLSINKIPLAIKFIEAASKHHQPLTVSSTSTSIPPQTQFQSTISLPTHSLIQPLGPIIDNLSYVDQSTLTKQVMEAEEQKKVMASPNVRKKVSFNKMKTIPEEQASEDSIENMGNRPTERIEGAHEDPLLSSEEIRELAPIEFPPIDLSTSVAFQPNERKNRQEEDREIEERWTREVKLSKVEIEGKRQEPENRVKNVERIEDEAREMPVEDKKEVFYSNPIIIVEEKTLIEDKKEVFETNPTIIIEDKMPMEDKREVFEANPVIMVEEKVRMEDKGIDTRDLRMEEEVKQVKVSPVFRDQMVDTTGLEVEREKEEEKIVVEEKIVMEDKTTDTYQLMITKDELTDTNELMDDERRKTLEELKAVKLSFLNQLFGLKETVEVMKREQAETKQGVCGSIEQTIEKLTKIVRASLDEYIEEKSKQQKENLLSYQLELIRLKDELSNVRAFAIYMINKVKGMLENYIQGEGKIELEKMIEESTRERIYQLGVSKINELIMDDGHSVSSESTHATPIKITPDKTPIKRPRRQSGSTTKKKTTKMDKAVLDGMLYLLDHEALKNPFRTDQGYKEKLERILRTPEMENLTSDLVLGSLMEERTRKKQIDFSDKEGRRRKRTPKSMKGSTKGDEEEENYDDDDETLSQQTFGDTASMRSERMEFLTPGKDSYVKKAKRSSAKFSQYSDQHGNKVFVVEEGSDSE